MDITSFKHPKQIACSSINILYNNRKPMAHGLVRCLSEQQWTCVLFEEQLEFQMDISSNL